MKKNVFLVVVLLFIGGATAQSQLKYGLKAGLNLSKISFNESALNDILDIGNYTGFQVGPMVEFTFPVLGFGLDAAVLYSQEGFKLNDISQSYVTNNLLIPVNLKYKLSFLEVVGVYVTAGPYADFTLSDNLKDQYESETFAAGLNFGIGVEFLAHLQIGVNYQLGLTDDFSVLKESGLVNFSSYDTNAKTRNWTISAAYLF
jgi:hypothetical protein